MFPEVAKNLKSKLWQLRFDGEASVLSVIDKRASIARASVASKLHVRGLPTRKITRFRRRNETITSEVSRHIGSFCPTFAGSYSAELLPPRDVVVDMTKMSELIRFIVQVRTAAK